MTKIPYRDLIILCIITLFLMGCSTEPTGLFYFDTIDPQDLLFQQNFTQALAYLNQDGQVSCILTTYPSNLSQKNTDAVKQTLILHTFWLPNQSKTSVSASSTNVTLEYLIESAGSFAFYRGAGFADLKHTKSLSDMDLDLKSSQIRLYRQSPGFKPSFIKTNINGRINADVAPEQAKILIEQFNHKIRDLTNNQ